jgi:hypothetical protein
MQQLDKYSAILLVHDDLFSSAHSTRRYRDAYLAILHFIVHSFNIRDRMIIFIQAFPQAFIHPLGQ